MLRSLTLAKLAPWLALAWLGSLVGVGFVAHGRGYDAAKTEHEGRGYKILADQIARARVVAEAVVDIGGKLQAALAESEAREPETRTIVRRITDANPDFSRVRRPADLQLLREQQLERIARAAAAD